MVRAVVQAVPAHVMRHQQWADAAGDRARRARETRLKQLKARKDAIDAGLALLKQEHRHGTKASQVLLRTGLYRHENVEVTDRDVDPALSPQRQAEHPGVLQAARKERKDARPPLSRLINRKGAAPHLLVGALAIANFREPAGKRPDLTDLNNTGKHSWSVVLGDPARSEQARRHVTDGLRRLRAEGLLGLKGLKGSSRQSFDHWEMWDEDGSRTRYTVPGVGLGVSSDFWLRGWASVLTGPEIATYLMVTHLAGQYAPAHAAAGIFAAPSRREQLFGITKGIYACANELEEFGLIERTTPRQPGNLPAGEKRQVDRWRVHQDALKRDAYETVTTVLRDKPTPARMARYDALNEFTEFLGIDLTPVATMPAGVPAQNEQTP